MLKTFFPGNMYTVSTPSDKTFDKIWLSPMTGTSDFTFKVMACDGANIALIPDPEDPNQGYHIHLGVK